jgi:spore photoproduct lyase
MIGSGEFTDSLVLDSLSCYSSQIIDFFRKYPLVSFEFKTKSDNIGNIIKAKPVKNIVISWSINPQKIISRHECLHV